VYNPKKGYKFTSKLIKKARKHNLNFKPIENMTRKEVIKTLEKAKVYIDFGNHPGKDRLPREAAIMGCCIIVGTKGSANHDIPIPPEFKLTDIPTIIKKIKSCLKNFKQNHAKFQNYRNLIKKEPQKFQKDLKKIFKKENQ